MALNSSDTKCEFTTNFDRIRHIPLSHVNAGEFCLAPAQVIYISGEGQKLYLLSYVAAYLSFLWQWQASGPGGPLL